MSNPKPIADRRDEIIRENIEPDGSGSYDNLTANEAKSLMSIYATEQSVLFFEWAEKNTIPHPNRLWQRSFREQVFGAKPSYYSIAALYKFFISQPSPPTENKP